MLGHLESFNRLAGSHEKIHMLARETVKSAHSKDGRASALYNELTNAVKNIQADIDVVKHESLSNVRSS